MLFCVYLKILFTSIENIYSYTEANVLFGNTHYNIGKQIINNMNISLSENEKSAFLSGIVYADIGRFIFDKKIGIDSDSTTFAKEMKKYTTTNEEKWFVRGIEMHIIQDQQTNEILTHIFGKNDNGYLNYIKKCSLLDCYFLRNNESYIYNEFLDKFNYEQVTSELDTVSIARSLGIPDNQILPMCKSIISSFYMQINKCNLITYNELIVKNYHSLGLKITQKDVQEQEANIVGASIIACFFASKQQFPDKLSTKIDAECKKVINLCTNAICKNNL